MKISQPNAKTVDKLTYVVTLTIARSTKKFWQGICSIRGYFVVMAIIWGLIVDKKRPDRFEIIAGVIVLVGHQLYFMSLDSNAIFISQLFVLKYDNKMC